jgi:ribonucleoside-diphosphate reductase alpha chain
MQSVLTKEILQSDYLEQYVFDYLNEVNNVISDRNILVVLDYLGYKWDWDETNFTISKIKKGKCKNVSIIKIEDVISETMDLETETTHSYKVNGLISHNTINLPSDATREQISEVYLKAHEMGVIGVTVYRDGCRDGILVHNTDRNNKELIVKTNAPKRPKRLPTHVYRVNIMNRISNESEKWVVFIGLLEDEPYEIIAGKINGHDFDNSVTEGEMVKVKRDGKNIYQFVHNDEILVDNIREQYLDGLKEYVTRLMSWGLRHGAGIEYLKEVLQKSNGSIVDFNHAIVRCISKFCKNARMEEKCPQCNSKLIYIEGCVKCQSPQCAWSKCG